MDTLFDHQNMSDDDLLTLIGALQDHQDTPNPNITALFQNANAQGGQSGAPAAAERPQTAILTPVPPPSARVGTFSPGAALADAANKASFSSLLGIPTGDQDQIFHFDPSTGNLVSGQHDDSVPNYQNPLPQKSLGGQDDSAQGIQMRATPVPPSFQAKANAVSGRAPMSGGNSSADSTDVWSDRSDTPAPYHGALGPFDPLQVPAGWWKSQHDKIKTDPFTSPALVIQELNTTAKLKMNDGSGRLFAATPAGQAYRKILQDRLDAMNKGIPIPGIPQQAADGADSTDVFNGGVGDSASNSGQGPGIHMGTTVVPSRSGAEKSVNFL